MTATPKSKRAGSRRKAASSSREGAFDAATERQIAGQIRGLNRLYPDADCELDHRDPLQLLIATILSAQSTDRRVNEVTASLFRKYRSAADFAQADPDVFEQEIRSTGFFRQKTKNVLGAARQIVERHDGEVPQTMEELVELAGVARKTANVVLGTAFGKAVGVVVDTHVRRLAYRLGLSSQSDPVKIERDLMERWPKWKWIFLGHATIWHGRRVCEARNPSCTSCGLLSHCPRNGLQPLDESE